MTKRVVNNSQVPHLWANQSQDSAKGGGAISFTGRTLYSYAAEIARLVDAPDGSLVALHISRTWSVTTSAHQSAGRSASHHMPSFIVPQLWVADTDCNSHAINLAYLIDQYQSVVARLTRQRNAPFTWQFDFMASEGKAARDYARLFGLIEPEIDVALDQAAITAVHNDPDRAAKRRVAAEKRAKQQAAREAAERVAHAVAINEWRAGVRNSVPSGARCDATGGALIRIHGDTLQTSMGAEVPLVDAIRVFRRVAACKAAGRTWHRNGDTIAVGSFQVDHIESDGSFSAGCHSFSWAEIENAAKLAGVLENA